MNSNKYSNIKKDDKKVSQFKNKSQNLNNQRRHFLNDNDDDDDEQNKFINQPLIKQQLINYIYNSIEISKFKYKLIEYEYDLPLLKENKYFISPNFNGINSLLVFTKLKDKFYSFLVDRKTLSYKHNQIDMSKVKIIPVDIRLDPTIYNGSIIDGVLLYNNGNNNTKTFVVNDVYYLCGQNLANDKINYKILNISTYFDSYHKIDSKIDNIKLIINKLYNLNEIKQLVNVNIPKSKYGNSIKGLAFYPEISNTKLIYLYNNCSQSKNESPSYSAVSHKPTIVRLSNITPNDSIIGTFRMSKTETVDVYLLYLAKIIEKNGKKYIKYKKFGIAYVPTKECSYFCKDLYDRVNNENILVECKYVIDKDKWIPFKHAEGKKKPDDVDEINKLIR